MHFLPLPLSPLPFPLFSFVCVLFFFSGCRLGTRLIMKSYEKTPNFFAPRGCFNLPCRFSSPPILFLVSLLLLLLLFLLSPPPPPRFRWSAFVAGRHGSQLHRHSPGCLLIMRIWSVPRIWDISTPFFPFFCSFVMMSRVPCFQSLSL